MQQKKQPQVKCIDKVFLCFYDITEARIRQNYLSQLLVRIQKKNVSL